MATAILLGEDAASIALGMRQGPARFLAGRRIDRKDFVDELFATLSASVVVPAGSNSKTASSSCACAAQLLEEHCVFLLSPASDGNAANPSAAPAVITQQRDGTTLPGSGAGTRTAAPPPAASPETAVARAIHALLGAHARAPVRHQMLRSQLLTSVATVSLALGLETCAEGTVGARAQSDVLDRLLVVAGGGGRADSLVDALERRAACAGLQGHEMARPGCLAHKAGHFVYLAERELTYAAESYAMLAACVLRHAVLLQAAGAAVASNGTIADALLLNREREPMVPWGGVPEGTPVAGTPLPKPVGVLPTAPAAAALRRAVAALIDVSALSSGAAQLAVLKDLVVCVRLAGMSPRVFSATAARLARTHTVPHRHAALLLRRAFPGAQLGLGAEPVGPPAPHPALCKSTQAMLLMLGQHPIRTVNTVDSDICGSGGGGGGGGGGATAVSDTSAADGTDLGDTTIQTQEEALAAVPLAPLYPRVTEQRSLWPLRLASLSDALHARAAAAPNRVAAASGRSAAAQAVMTVLGRCFRDVRRETSGSHPARIFFATCLRLYRARPATPLGAAIASAALAEARACPWLLPNVLDLGARMAQLPSARAREDARNLRDALAADLCGRPANAIMRHLHAHLALTAALSADITTDPGACLEALTRVLTHTSVCAHGDWETGRHFLGVARAALATHPAAALRAPLSGFLDTLQRLHVDVDVRDQAGVLLALLHDVAGSNLRSVVALSSSTGARSGGGGGSSSSNASVSGGVSALVRDGILLPSDYRRAAAMAKINDLPLIVYCLGSVDSPLPAACTIKGHRGPETLSLPQRLLPAYAEYLGGKGASVAAAVNLCLKVRLCPAPMTPGGEKGPWPTRAYALCLRFSGSCLGAPVVDLCVPFLEAASALEHTASDTGTPIARSSLPAGSRSPFATAFASLPPSPAPNTPVPDSATASEALSPVPEAEVKTLSCSAAESTTVMATVCLKPLRPEPLSLDINVELTDEHSASFCGRIAPLHVAFRHIFSRVPLPPSWVHARPAVCGRLYRELWSHIAALEERPGGGGALSVQNLRLAPTALLLLRRELGPFVVQFEEDEEEEEGKKDHGFESGQGGFEEMHALVFLPPQFHLLLHLRAHADGISARLATDRAACLPFAHAFLQDAAAAAASD